MNKKNDEEESAGIYLENVTNAHLEGTKFIGYKKSIVAKNSEGIQILNNISRTHEPNSPEEFAKILEQNKKIIENLEKAKTGDNNAKEFLKTMLGAATSSTTVVGIKMLLKQYGVEL